MPAIGMLSGFLLLSAGLLVEGQQYTISTHAGGIPLPPSVAVSMAADSLGNLYFVDALAGEVFRVDPPSSFTRIARNSRTDFTGDGALAINAALDSPRGVATDASGNLDAGNQRVRRVTADGIINTYQSFTRCVLGGVCSR